MLKALGIAGSPDCNGNTEILLDRFLEGAAEAGAHVEKVILAEFAIANCAVCHGCRGDAECVINDGFHTIKDKLIVSDIVALSAPLFFMNVPAQVKALIDRSQSQWVRKHILKHSLPTSSAGLTKRRGIFLCVGGSSKAKFEGVRQTVRAFFSVWEVSYWAELLYSGVDEKGEISQHPKALQDAFRLGQETVRAPRDT